MRLALCIALLCAGCVAVEVRPDRVRAVVVGQAAVATGCPSQATPATGGTALAGAIDATAGSPCAAVQGGPISGAMSGVLGLIGGALLRGGLP